MISWAWVPAAFFAGMIVGIFVAELFDANKDTKL